MASKDSAEFLVEKFGRRYSVVFGLELENQIANEQLYHVSTYFHYGRVEAGFEPPPEVTPGARVTMVARATARLPAGDSPSRSLRLRKATNFFSRQLRILALPHRSSGTLSLGGHLERA